MIRSHARNKNRSSPTTRITSQSTLLFLQKMRKGKRKGDAQQDRVERPNWAQIVFENEQMRRYYLAQGIVDASSVDEWLKSLATPLPTTFRITGSRNHAENVRAAIVRDYMPTLRNVQVAGETFEAPRPLAFYPDEMAYSCQIPRGALRKHPEAADFHQFLITETENGNITRQEAVSMIPPLLLDVQSHHYVIDLCAAPGSKTGQLIEALHANQEPPTGMIIANDADFKRSTIMVRQTKRFESANVVVTHADASAYPQVILEDGTLLEFDRVLCDVPCSGDGTIRKNVTLWNKWNYALGNPLHDLQVRILRRGLQMTKVGGRLVYSTCSFNPIENEAVVAQALADFGGMIELVDVSQEMPNLKRRPGVNTWKVFDKAGNVYTSWTDVPKENRGKLKLSMFPPAKPLGLEKCVRIMPQDQDTGGFFVAVFTKLKSFRRTRIKHRGKAKGTAVEDVEDETVGAELADVEETEKIETEQTEKIETEQTEKSETEQIQPGDKRKRQEYVQPSEC